MYYLPINISERRIHICEMKSGESDPVFGFLFTGETLFQTSPFGNNELIAFRGDNVNLKDYHFELKNGEKDGSGKNVYDFYIEKNSDSENDVDSKNETHKIDNDVPFAIDSDNNSFSRGGVKVRFKLRGSRRIVADEFIIKIHFKTEGEDFSYAFKGYLAEAGNGGNIIDAAIDFGSEASQIKIGTARININQEIYENFYKTGYHRLSTSTSIDYNKDLWQSDKDHLDLYRSAYFIHKSPDETKFGDAPNNHKEKTYIQALMPLTVEKNYYKELLRLPNLKLMDLMDDMNNVMLDDIKMNGEEFLKGTNASNLSDGQFRQNTLRLILSNLMHCVIASTNAKSSDTKRYLRLVMLMPNVYDQKKVYNIVEGLYRDFDTITNTGQDKKYNGIEVAVISESDASFLGVLQKHQRLIESVPDAPNQYYLIIDAGKGTTDFSVMHTSDGNITVWNSLFRGGLPASGHAMTYAVYEAIWAFFKRQKDVDIDNFLRDENTDLSTVRDFMSHLETLKANYSNYQEVKDDKITMPSNCGDLSQVNTIIKENIINKHVLVEGTREIMRKKETEMSRLIVKGIKNYMGSAHKGQKFGKVLLTGRAFMLEEFSKTVVEALNNGDMVVNNKCINVLPAEELKKICLDGSTSIGSKYFINNNSELICRPTVVNPFRNNRDGFFSKIEKWFSKLGETSDTAVDDAFYYNGIKVENPKNAQLTMGLGSNWIHGANYIYYVGRGLLVKRNNNNNSIDELTPQVNEDRDDSLMIAKLTRESLFPYYPSSIPDQGAHKALYVPKYDGSQAKKSDELATQNAVNQGETEPKDKEILDDDMNFDNL